MPLNNPTDTVIVDNLTENIAASGITISKSAASVGGVKRVTISYSAHQANISGIWYNVPAGSVLLNSADVTNPTTYYIYAGISGGSVVVKSSVIDPEDDSEINYQYSWIAIARIKSVADTATIYYLRDASTPATLLLHYIGEFDYYTRPTWVKGGGVTINATTGVVDMEELEYRRMRFDRELDAITAGSILYEDESAAVANLELITTYSDGSAITAGKYHKILIGAILGQNSTAQYMIVRQGKPDTEYTTLAEALADSENKAGTSFPFTYRGGIFSIAYVAMLLGDASDLVTVDLRSTGVGGGSGGGGGAITDHGALTGLGDDDHTQYLLADGSRDLSGNMSVSAGVTIDGVDVSAHAANAAAHHAAVTITAAADTVLSLSTQEIGFDNQAANLVLAGPASGAAATPTFRSLVAADLARAHGTIYTANGVAAQALTAATPAKLTLFATDGISLLTGVSAATDSITLANSGSYQVSAQFSITTNINNVLFQFHLARGGVNTYLGAHRKTGTSPDVGSCSFIGQIDLTAGDVLTINIEADKTNNITLVDGQFSVMRIA